MVVLAGSLRLHYFGQSLLMQDFLYRNMYMYRVKYLAFIDLGENFLLSTKTCSNS